ncbi:Lipid-binding ER protein [Komagataella phaffii CBS 7435]|uniref:SMP-LTD domain-containing protein n=2 Tax=Komagataella phaffii TaxID=460519 RepID=C4R287_KOMPG|nr:uncharacterized protein PAS_chr2-2_0296 [Komagataella phaffii GS115]AOA62603.1 GQ67_01031T0 [Komagataella phaffii]CAH2447840.1 Lipid-binding ER protein [Komagataella phaffii CBS 7435]AOA67723.1 GQ68_00358T0 [Komagataella phaffii GS115]CAY69611.1 Putative protein of unknown function [Komagataella phaffii GS115]CCA38008.1 Lipid-binding ER protein [Komagataella phaffii CBS 7435]
MFFFLLFIYVLGGVTFVPLVLYCSFYLAGKSVPLKPELDEDPPEKFDAGVYEDENTNGVNTYMSGWLTVTREFYHFSQVNPSELNSGNNNSTALENSSIDSKFSLYKKKEDEDDHDPLLVDAKKLRILRRKNRYMAELKHGNLFLYSDEQKTNVQHVIVLANYGTHFVSVWPRNLPDNQLFTKRSAICIMKKKPDLLEEISESGIAPKGSYFIYADLNHEKEDWYFALLKASKRDYIRTNDSQDLLEPSLYADVLHFQNSDMINLIQILNSTEGQLTSKWFNALIGRLFLAIQNTKKFKDSIRARVDSKLQKIRRPGFLDDFQIEHIDVGNSAPFITHPKLKDLTPEGALTISTNFLYEGKLTVDISTKVSISLGNRFKTKEVNVKLRIKVVKLQGLLLIKMKPPPSNRLWYAFEKMPLLDLQIDPIVSSRSFNYNLITKIIGNKFKEAVRESLVHPFYDDFVFYSTECDIFRGGIWNSTQSQSHPDSMDSRQSPEASEDVDLLSVETQETNRTAEYSLPIGDNEVDADTVSLRSKATSTISDLTKRANTNLKKLNRKSETDLLDSPSILSSDSAFQESKKYVSTSIKKIGKWYKERKDDSTVNLMTETYNPPEMIQSRRGKKTAPSLSSEKDSPSSRDNHERVPSSEMFVYKEKILVGSPSSSGGRFHGTPHSHITDYPATYDISEIPAPKITSKAIRKPPPQVSTTEELEKDTETELETNIPDTGSAAKSQKRRPPLPPRDIQEPELSSIPSEPIFIKEEVHSLSSESPIINSSAPGAGEPDFGERCEDGSDHESVTTNFSK